MTQMHYNNLYCSHGVHIHTVCYACGDDGVPVPVTDNVNHPPHYTKGNIECIEALEAMVGADHFLSHCQLTAVAYLWRWRDKGGAEDLKKAKRYVERMIFTLEKEKKE